MSLKALFIKSPFKYMELSGDTILAEKDLLGFDSFKRVVLALREEKGFHNSEGYSIKKVLSERIFHKHLFDYYSERCLIFTLKEKTHEYINYHGPS